MSAHAEAPAEPGIEVVDDTINSYPDPRESDGPQLSAAETSVPADAPGPSTTYIPRQPSPPLPELNTRSFPAMDGSDESDDEDDEPVATLPIYLSPALAPHLDLYQYPLQHRSFSVPSWAKDRGKSISARVKEKVGRVEVEIPVDAGQSYWREDRARDLGFVMDVRDVNGDPDVEGGYGFGGRGGGSSKDKEKKAKEKKRRDEKWGDKMRLRSELVPNATGYYSGVIRDGALHLHPVSKLLQFRTALNYLDDADDKARERSTRRSNGLANGNGDSDDEGGDGAGKKKKGAAPAPVKDLRPARKVLDEEDNDGSGSIKDFRNKMWWMAKKEDEDQWVPYQWTTGVEDEGVAETLDKLIVPDEKRERLTCKTRGLDFLDRPDKMQIKP
ncbi:DNA-directed RNA polymerase III subunit RPC5 [Kwoniella heveanensis BCC8398]|uniref:DNA-directed RNA polymerase III subunit RPC5 n=1 Tax=Kwoniella heveanensis BCC8398 TaxID=1296120 RepID=A0A1B9GIA9_9TREE|nr:DNA-directed RNA polymerase III subunit RPC5 [Kwoniella heveanensis BCC8398]